MNIHITARRCLCATILTLSLAACGHSASSRPDGGRVAESGSSTTTTSGVSTTTTASAQSAVIDAYLAYWRAVDSYGSQTAPFDANQFKTTFDPVATGAQYDSLFQRLQLNRAQGLVYRGRENAQHRPVVTDLSGDRAVLTDCADDFGGIFDTRQNTYVQPLTPGEHSKITAVLTKVNGAWKVSTQGAGDTRCTP
ncbi:MAG TPA: hypothetical protein VFE55_14500 [Acidimicrobiia bacterium]|nr:hypothetical protein [Acidimicrobiia bacterium]